MNTEYSRPRQRVRSFGAGLLSGSAVTQDEVVEQIKDNLDFRRQSLRGILMGSSGTDSMSPIERRMKIMERRREVLGDSAGPIRGAIGDMVDSDDSGSASATAKPNTSGQVGTSTTTSTGASAQSTKDSTPSMSEVDKGTKARAQDRGFGG